MIDGTMKTKTKMDRSFAFLNLTQFSGALNDNLFKFLMTMYLIDQYPVEKTNTVTTAVAAVFVMPFLLFLPIAGKFADRFSKRNIVVVAKVSEAFIMVVGFLAFYFQSPMALYFTLFLMATQSTFFSPAKYGIIPELVEADQVSRANSYIEAMTYLAIIFGTVGASFILKKITGEDFGFAAAFCVLFAIIGCSFTFPIRKTPPANKDAKPSVFFIRDILRTILEIRHDKNLLMAVLASAYFLMIGAFIQMNLFAYGREVLDFDSINSGYLFFFCAIGIGAGSFWAGRLSGRHVELGIVPIGALGLSLSMFLLAGASNMWVVFALLVLLGVSGGLYVVPIHSFVQIKSPKAKRGQVLAASSFIGWIGVLLSAGMLYVFSEWLKLSASQVFVVISLLTLILTVVTIIKLPDFLVRFLTLFIARICYRIKVVDEEKVPAQGGVMIVSNHVSWIDAVLLSAAQTRRIRFVMDRAKYESKWLHPIFKLMRVIPISATDPPKKIVESLRQARAAMDDGEIVCIFAEGTITRTGMLREFKSGYKKIIKNSDYKIVPAYIGGAWGSIFSYYKGKLLSSLPSKFPYPISIHFGDPLPSNSTPTVIRQKVMELSCDYFGNLKSTRKTLGETFVRIARRKRFRKCLADTTGKNLNYLQTLITAVSLADKLKKTIAHQDRIGIIMPPSVTGALSNIAVTMLGKIPVNLSYVTSPEVRASAIAQCGIKTVITSKLFLRKAEIKEDLPGVIYIEDFVKSITSADKFKAAVKAFLVPRRILSHSYGKTADDVATIIFSSGSTGQPKGVMLSHHNILSNIETMRLVFKIKLDDDLCGVLPFFHSFGYTCSLWLPIISGVSASYIPNPLDAKLVGESIKRNNSTILFAPPTFFLSYIRRGKPEDFASLREAMVGAEKLKQKLTDAFMKKFGKKLLEGYGATELSPVATLNIPDADVGGVFQPGSKPGTAGHPLPGIATKIVDTETGEMLGPDKPGLLMIKGPNVMLGYLGMEEETKAKLVDDWYDTGDIASIDAEGFITITDRLSRFSKIGGEMVPHLAIEEVLLEGILTHEHVLAVTSIPDQKKGEQLVVMYIEEFADPDTLRQIADKSDLPNMWKPKKTNYFKLNEMPILGSGKIDIIKLRKTAIEAAEKNSTLE
ncbi:MAG: MFS transporter [Planctomycetes bacterium]|nr:MFS transporter [Planctomycetota bacterium]